MQLHPTRPTFHMALAGAAVVAMGTAARLPAVVAFGSAMILAIAIGRALAQIATVRLRTAGFEMVWARDDRVVRARRGEDITLVAELRNRSRESVHVSHIRGLASSMLQVTVEPEHLDLAPGARANVTLRILAPRVGRWGVHGLALDVRGMPAGGDGLFEVPLVFANPCGIEVLPTAVHATATHARGGRSRRVSAVGRAAPLPGEGDELRELREHVAGDAFKRIAWKASARRGQLLVREMEREERDIVWLVLDASVELWAGERGHAPLDAMVDDVAALAVHHAMRGDHVGLVVVASRVRGWIEPNTGPSQLALIGATLVGAASMVDADRSELDEFDVAQRIVEHARPLDPSGLADLPKGDLDALVARADQLRMRAPFLPPIPFATTPREQRLRHYLAAFGLEIAPRTDGERERTEVTLAHTLERLGTLRPRPSLIHVWAPAPNRTSPIVRAIRLCRGRHVDLAWSLPNYDDSLSQESGHSFAEAIQRAVDIRARAAKSRGEIFLRQLRVRIANARRHPAPRARAVLHEEAV